MTTVYAAIGRAVVGYVRRRYARQIRFAAGFALAGLALGAYLATRESPQP